MYNWLHTVTVKVINALNIYRRDQKKLEPQKKPMALQMFQALADTFLISPGRGMPLYKNEPMHGLKVRKVKYMCTHSMRLMFFRP